ncbi:hypothetical protein N7539_008298 [Penicillium diatomitis]|uniref:Uncharacterized protein n=1 Tax=Penicillium diatomitis TaxID=2819901 RepID=A0A9W9WTH5_9EURO|nr:uncharacterized protein N7539_008298 [Penicillium diatomitis]KAJ5475232.1 hypothetical protein N7539_008298 [Penicillium diatomitis]
MPQLCVEVPRILLELEQHLQRSKQTSVPVFTQNGRSDDNSSLHLAATSPGQGGGGYPFRSAILEYISLDPS